MRMSLRALSATALVAFAALAGCTQGPATTSTSDAPAPPAAGLPPVPAVDAAALLADLEAFSTEFPERHSNLPTHEASRVWLLDQFASYGLAPWRHNFTSGGMDQANVAGIQWGSERSEVVVVGGHFDTTHWDCVTDVPVVGCAGHKASHGAYDDGSGTLLTLHLAKAFANVTTRSTIVYIGFDGEERGLEGAAAFAEDLLDGATPLGNVTLRAVLDMDMFGITWPGTEAPIQVIHNSEPLFAAFERARLALGVPDDMVYQEDLITLGASDFRVFMERDIPTIFFSSDMGKFAAPGPVPAHAPYMTYPFWHLADSYATMVASAGSEERLRMGFTTASTLAAAVLHAMALDPALVLE